MCNQSGHEAINRFAAHIVHMMSRRDDVHRTFVDALSAALVAFGAVAFPVGLTLGAANMPGVLVGAAAIAGAGAIALILSRSGRAANAIRVQTVTLAVVGLLAAFVSSAPFAGLGVLVLAACHWLVWAKSSLSSRRWLATVGMAAITATLAAISGHSMFWIPAVTLTLYDVAAVWMIFAKRQIEVTSDGHSLSELLESISDGLVRLQADGMVLHASPATEKMFGCKAYSLAQSGLLERVHVLDRPMFLKAVSDTAHDRTARQVELRMRRDPAPHESGETRFVWSEIAISGGPDENDMPSVFGLIRDISDRKAQEQKLEDARFDAERTSDSKSLFLATMGHELRTPLNAIVGFSEMMTSGIGGTLDDTHTEYATLIGQSGRHLLDVVNMLLDMSKINAGKFELHLEEFEPDSLIEPSVHMVSAMARSRQVRVDTDLANELPIFKGDERACRQIIINLLSNAIKFSHADGVVSLSMRRQGAKLNITVSDNGIGMSREQVARIGEPFFQAHAGLARQYEGTGLGLSIVKGLVDLHDGVMRAKSTLNQGTTITVLLPLLGPETDQQPTIVTPLRPAVEEAGEPQFEPSGKQSIAS